MSEYAVEPRRVEKPWGWELIWALTDDYCGKLLFVKAGEELSLQYHEVKDESWYVERGRAELELGALDDGERTLVEIGPERLLPLSVPHGAPSSRARGHADRRGLDLPARRRRPPRGRLRARRDGRTLTSLC